MQYKNPFFLKSQHCPCLVLYCKFGQLNILGYCKLLQQHNIIIKLAVRELFCFLPSRGQHKPVVADDASCSTAARDNVLHHLPLMVALVLGFAPASLPLLVADKRQCLHKRGSQCTTHKVRWLVLREDNQVQTKLQEALTAHARNVNPAKKRDS